MKPGNRLIWVGSSIAAIGLILGLWGGDSGAIRVAVTLLLLVAGAVFVAGVLRLGRGVAADRSQPEGWDSDVKGRLDALEDTESAATREAASRAEFERLADASNSSSAKSDATLEELATELGRLGNAHHSRDGWALDIEASLQGLREVQDVFEDRVRSGRAADHSRLADLEIGLYELALRTELPLPAVLSPGQARLLVSRFARSSDYLRVKPLLDAFAVDHPDVLWQLETVRLVAAFKMYRRLGYLNAQAMIARYLLDRTDSSVSRSRLLASIEESQFFADVREFEPPSLGDGGGVYDLAGPIIHVVGKTLPDTQTGYTLRTQYSVRALQRRGVESVVLSQAGAPGGDLERMIERDVQGVRCITVPGPARYETTYSEWLRGTIAESAKVVRRLRPSVLHAHSDFLNAMVAVHIGRVFGIPVVYESRGFWEESWLSRTLDAHGLTDEYEDLVSRAGAPEAHAGRQAAEIAMREESDANLTLGRTMRDHIIELAAPGSLDRDEIRIVPNGIEPGLFPISARDEALLSELGLLPGDAVIGCISSIVEYEGIDLLVRAFGALERSANAGARPRLLIVGDGTQLEPLQALVAELGIQGAVFTGRVPHEDIQSYYGLIDVFVVPRRPTPVSRLVTPLKPFEALATGRALVVSDVEALSEIAEDACGAVAQFRAGDVDDLERVLSELIDDPDRRAAMGRRGADWVSRERTWDANAAVYEEVYRALGAQAHRAAEN